VSNPLITSDISPMLRVPSLDAEVSEFERLRERAHEQIAALATTIAQLEALRQEIERHLG